MAVKGNTAALDERVSGLNDTLAGMAKIYLEHVDRLVAFNAKQEAARKQAAEGAWTATKLIGEAKSKRENDNDVETLFSEFEKIKEQYDNARNALASHMAGKLEVSMAVEVPKPSEEDVKDLAENARQPAVSIGQAMTEVVKYTNDTALAERVNTLLSANPIPQIGRAGSLDVTGGAASTKKHRVDVTAIKDGETVISSADGRGFTKAALAAKKFNGPDASAFRKAWEDNGEKDTEFEHNGVSYFLKARPKAN